MVAYPDHQTQIALRRFLLERWRERADELGRERSETLDGSCKFVSLFCRRVFGGSLRGNFDHQWVEIDGRILDPTFASRGAYIHDPDFWGNEEHLESMRSCESRVQDWVQLWEIHRTNTHDPGRGGTPMFLVATDPQTRSVHYSEVESGLVAPEWLGRGIQADGSQQGLYLSELAAKAAVQHIHNTGKFEIPAGREYIYSVCCNDQQADVWTVKHLEGRIPQEVASVCATLPEAQRIQEAIARSMERTMAAGQRVYVSEMVDHSRGDMERSYEQGDLAPVLSY